MKAYVFPNSNVAVFDDKGKQVPELQGPLIVMHAEKAEELGYDPTSIEYEMGSYRWRCFRTSEGRLNFESI